MNKIKYLILLLSLSIYGQGLNFTPQEQISDIPELPSDTYGFATDIPYAYSLEKYVPPVLRQEGGTCVGFAAFYYALSTMYNQVFEITSIKEKYAYSFDPYFIYSIVYNNEDDCDSGLYFKDAFMRLNKIGAKKLFYPPFTSCDTEWTKDKLMNILEYTVPYSIKNWYIIDNKKPNFINVVKEMISGYDSPVIVGMSLVKSMYPYSSANVNGVKSDGLWFPNTLEESTGGHALCIVGYDDYKFGGAFRVVNSWGRDYGEKGFIWVKYSDLKIFAKEAYALQLNKNIVEKPPMVIEEDNYKRYKYTTEKQNYNAYEGQYLNNSVTGYGIWSDKDNDTYYIGRFNKASMNGYFFIIDDEGIFSANAVNGKFYDIDKLGFAENEELMQTELMAKKFFKKFGPDFTIRKANSTKRNDSKPAKN